MSDTYAAAARPTAPGDDVEVLRAEVVNLQARLAGSEAERCKMADTAVAGWVEHNRLRRDAEDRAAAAEAALAKARADALKEAAQIVEKEPAGVEVDRFTFEGRVARNGEGDDLFISTSRASTMLRRIASGIRALTPTDGGA